MIKYQCDNCGRGFVPSTQKSNKTILYKPITVGDNWHTEDKIEYALCNKCLKKLNRILKRKKKKLEKDFYNKESDQDMGWVTVEEKLPNKSGDYLVQWKLKDLINIELTYYNKGTWIAVRDSLNITSRVVAWMNINPYEGKE